MRLPSSPRLPAVRRTLRRALLTTLGAQATTVATLLAVDEIRKKERPQRPFPRLPAKDLPVPGGEVRLYTYGADLYEDMLADIAAATERIYFESFIWKDDEVGRRFKAAFVAAHERGVAVYLAYDRFANLVVPRSFFDDLPPGIDVKAHPILGHTWKVISPRYSGRNHRKLLVVDGRSAYLGGYNIGGLYATGWRDTHARFRGDMVVEFENAFVDYWNIHLPGDRPQLPQPPRRSWRTTLRVQRNVPADLVYPIRGMYLEAIDRAERRVYLTSAYLIPDLAFRRALISAAARGVDVRLLVPLTSNHVVADWISRYHYEELLRGGVRLLRYQGAMIHAKTATIDGVWSTVGTANIDRLSLAGNYELNVEIVDPQVAAAMEQIFDLDSGSATELTLEQWQRRPWIFRVAEGLLSPWGPVL